MIYIVMSVFLFGIALIAGMPRDFYAIVCLGGFYVYTDPFYWWMLTFMSLCVGIVIYIVRASRDFAR